VACALNALSATPDDVMRAAGYDVDHGIRSTPRWDMRYSINHPVYEIMYEFPGQTMFLSVDPTTSETIDIQGQPGRGSNPTSNTISLTPQWAQAKLLSLNPYKIARGLVHMGEPVISYDTESAKYEVLFHRLDGSGHQFDEGAAFFDFDHATSRVTHLHLGVYLPEPAVTTGTMISQEQGTTTALQWLIANRSKVFEHVPDKMTFDYIPESTTVRVVKRDVTSDTVVAYKILRFESRLTDPSYTGRYEKVKVLCCVDVFSGAVVAGNLTKMFAGGK
jgi:hypothetical protein